MADNVPKSPYTGIPGWETVEEENRLTELAESVPKYGVIVELGAEYGRSMAGFIRGSDDTVELYSVDLFPKDHPEVGDLLAEYQRNVSSVDASRQIGIMQGDSAEAAKHWPADKEIDLLFIDAGHEYEQVAADIAGWTQFVARGGVVAFHDCAVDEKSHYLHHEVNRAVDDWKRGDEWVELPQVDSLRVFMRAR